MALPAFSSEELDETPREQPTAVLAESFDAARRKRPSEDLLLQKALLEQLFDCAPEGIIVQSNEGVVLRANAEFCRMFGFSLDDVLDRRLDELISSHEERAEANALSRHVAAGGKFNVESVRTRKDGSRIEVSILGTPIRVNGDQIGVYVIYRDITERKQAEQALVESESKFRAVADTAASAICIQTPEKFLYVNHAAEAISGYTRQELMSMRPRELVHPFSRQLLQGRPVSRNNGDGDTPSRYEVEIVAKNGEERWVDFSVCAIQFGGQEASLAIAFDITQRKKAERLQSALYRIADCANSAQDLQALYSSIHAIVSELVYAKNFYIALYDQAKGLLTWPYFVDEEDPVRPAPKPLGRGLTEYVLRTGQPLLASPEQFDQLVAASEVELIGAPSIDWLGVPLKRGDKTFGVIVVQSYSPNFRYGHKEREILTFVSQHVASAIEHKRDQDALRRSEARYRSLFERAAYGICRCTPTCTITDANPALASMLAYDSADQLIGLNGATDLFVDSEEHARAVGEFRLEGSSFEARWRRKDGKIITVKLSARAALDATHNLRGYELIVEDVSERRALEDQLRHAQKMEAVGRLAGGVAHDFNNLLTVIKGYSELVVSELVEADPMRAQVEEIRKAADRATALTRQLLAFSRRQVLAPKVLDLNTAVLNMDRLLRRLLGNDVELCFNFSSDLGRVKADPGQIEQVVMNLAVNARDALPQGGRLEIATSNLEFPQDWMNDQVTIKAGRYVVLDVIDNGIGMPEDVRSRVFEPFFTTKERGTGLGLSTVYGIVKQSGGYIWVTSKPGEGATFRIYLPRVDEATEESTTTAVNSDLNRGTETVLLVEEDDGVRPLVRQMLHKHGYRVMEARNAGEALLLCERDSAQIHLLLTNVVLSQMSGSELSARLLALKPEMRVLYTSGYTEDAVIRQGILDSAVAFVQKPFTADLLVLKVRAVLDSAATSQSNEISGAKKKA